MNEVLKKANEVLKKANMGFRPGVNALNHTLVVVAVTRVDVRCVVDVRCLVSVLFVRFRTTYHEST